MNMLMIICQKSSGSVSTSSKCSSINSENSASSGLMVKGLLLLQINTIYTKYQIGFCNLLVVIQIYLNLYGLFANRLRMCPAPAGCGSAVVMCGRSNRQTCFLSDIRTDCIRANIQYFPSEVGIAKDVTRISELKGRSAGMTHTDNPDLICHNPVGDAIMMQFKCAPRSVVIRFKFIQRVFFGMFR